MSETVKTVTESSVLDVARRAKAASRLLALLPRARRDEVLYAAADEIEARRDEIISANEIDCRMAARDVEQGSMPRALFERLQTNERGIRQMAAGVREVAALEDPLGRELAVTELDDGLTLYKVTCPLGVIGVIFEARPDVISQVSALALKSGNALLLKGGAEAVRTNETLASIWRDALSRFPDVA